MTEQGSEIRRSGLLAVEVALLYIASVGVAGTGLVYAWFRYFAVPVDPFAVVANPWQPFVQHLHVVLAPLLVFASGTLWRSHVWATWRSRRPNRRRSGLVLALSIVPMVASGYFVQIAQEESWRHTWGIVHTTVSVAWVVGSVIHFVARGQRKNAKPATTDRTLPLPPSPVSVPPGSPAHQNATRTPS